MKIVCPKHPSVELLPLYLNYNTAKKLRRKQEVELFYCVTCHLPYHITVEAVQ